jgi:hypothetical protein
MAIHRVMPLSRLQAVRAPKVAEHHLAALAVFAVVRVHKDVRELEVQVRDQAGGIVDVCERTQDLARVRQNVRQREGQRERLEAAQEERREEHVQVTRHLGVAFGVRGVPEGFDADYMRVQKGRVEFLLAMLAQRF